MASVPNEVSTPPPAVAPDGTAVPNFFSRRRFLKLAGSVAAVATVTSCAPRTTAPEARKGGKVQLAFQDCRCLGEQLLLQDFHDANPHIEVFYIPEPDDYEDSMLADMQAGVAPDVFAGCCDTLPIWAQKGYLLDLYPFVESDLSRETIDDWDGAQYNSFFTSQGLQFALPKYHGALALYYNKDLFDRYQIGYPTETWTHDDYLLAMQRLKSAAAANGDEGLWGSMFDVSWERIQVHVNGWNGHFVDPEEPTRSLMGDLEALTAMEWLRARMWDDRVMASKLDVANTNTRDAFIRERVAMVEEGSWALRDILEQAKFRIGVAPFPAGPERRVTLATTDGFAVFSETRQPEAAWDLLKFLTGREYGRAMAKAQLLQPARASLVNDWVELVREQYPAESAEIDLAVFAGGHIEGYSVTAEVFANMSDARELTRAAWEKIYTLGQASVDIMKTTSALIEDAQPAQSTAQDSGPDPVQGWG
jgi:multiple sugar transport system substrate-binding protein